MAKVKLEIEAEPAQIDALKFEISRHIETLYSKNVPAIVRDYIAANIENKKNERRSEAI